MSEQSTQPTFNFTGLTIEQVNIILAGLGELPQKVSGALYQGLASAAQEQLDKHNASQPAA